MTSDEKIPRTLNFFPLGKKEFYATKGYISTLAGLKGILIFMHPVSRTFLFIDHLDYIVIYIIAYGV